MNSGRLHAVTPAQMPYPFGRRLVAVYDARTIPEKVTGGTKDSEIAERLKTGPVLGAHTPIHVQRPEHDAFIDTNPLRSAGSNFSVRRDRMAQ